MSNKSLLSVFIESYKLGWSRAELEAYLSAHAVFSNLPRDVMRWDESNLSILQASLFNLNCDNEQGGAVVETALKLAA